MKSTIQGTISTSAVYTNVRGIQVRETIKSVTVSGTVARVEVEATEKQGLVITTDTFFAVIPCLVVNQ